MKLAPALAAGNTVVLKPPPETPLYTYLLAEAAMEAGLPDGVLSILPAGADISELLVRDPGVDKVSFTGSTAVGRQVGAICGASLKRCTLELGGKSAAIVLDDFELTDATAKMLVMGAMVNAGQVCAAQTRILVPAARHDEIAEAMSQATRALQVGDPGSPETDIGPLISQRQRDRVERYIALGIAEGACLLAGGGRPAIDTGWYVEPTLFAEVGNQMTIAREEIFGPVAAVIPYRDEAEAITLANESEYGLAGAVWTADLDRGERVAGMIRTGVGGGQLAGRRWTPTGRSAGSRTPVSAGRAAPRRSPTTPKARLSCCPRRRSEPHSDLEGARPMSVLVLGSSGLVGRRLVRRLVSEGQDVLACDVRHPVDTAGGRRDLPKRGHLADRAVACPAERA